MHVLVTGGAGYIGSHTCLELLKAGYQVTVIDNLCNSHRESLRRVMELTGKSLDLHQVDLLNQKELEQVFEKCPNIQAVIHFAGLKSLGESIEQPLNYYTTNLVGTLNLCNVMQKYGIKNIVFSSSASVYGAPATVPILENFPLSCTNPYGKTKLMTEEILADLHVPDPEWNVIILRYFNPVGAHKSGQIGEDPGGIPCNLVPYISQVAAGKLEKLAIYGSDYPTTDGTGVRDFIHVVDLALGHLKALEKLAENPGVVTYNLGTGQGYSVLEMITAFEKVSGREVRYSMAERRAGDIGTCYANPALAKEELGWEAHRGLEDMCADTWRWQSQNPDGFAGYE